MEKMLERLKRVLVSKVTYKIEKSASLFSIDNALTKTWESSRTCFLFSVSQFC